MKKFKYLMLVVFATPVICLSQDIRGGEIRFSHLNGLTVSFDIYLYTQTSMGISHSTISFGSGIGTLTGTSINLPSDITEWHYTSVHTFPGTGIYTVSAQDSFRMASIQNINNSSIESIYLQSQFNINAVLGANSSPVLMNKQTDVFKNGNYFVHDPSPYDPDGDSLSFSLVPATTSNYVFPSGATIDALTGIFQMPIASGIYAINIKIDEWRSGLNIATTYREMVIDSNTIVGINPPSIEDVNFMIYPNPFTSDFSITIEKQNLKHAAFTIKNILGQAVFNMQENNLDNTYTKTIDLSFLSKGIYLLDVIIDGERTVKKIVKE